MLDVIKASFPTAIDIIQHTLNVLKLTLEKFKWFNSRVFVPHIVYANAVIYLRNMT